MTGGSRGIGRAIALELGRAGAEVVVGYRTGREEAEAVAAEIGGRAVEADVSDADSAKALVESPASSTSSSTTPVSRATACSRG